MLKIFGVIVALVLMSHDDSIDLLNIDSDRAGGYFLDLYGTPPGSKEPLPLLTISNSGEISMMACPSPIIQTIGEVTMINCGLKYNTGMKKTLSVVGKKYSK